MTRVTRYERERADAIAFFADKANYFNDKKLVETSFDFKVYTDKALAKVLSKDFREKCAYCESKFGAATSGDIEHFRPKASILSGKDELKPGYDWLAGDWDNFLISCPHCNRVRSHEVPGRSGFSYADGSAAIDIRKASIHHHFPAKPDLAKAVVCQSRDEFSATMTSLKDEGCDALAQWRANVGHLETVHSDGIAPFCVAGMPGAELPA